MHRRYCILFFIIACYFSSACFGQRKVFELSYAGKEKVNRLYSSIRVIDIRDDPDYFGMVEGGSANKNARITVDRPLQDQLNDMLDSISYRNNSNSELVLLIRQFSFAEVLATFGEKGYCLFRAMLFTPENGQYKLLSRIDTVGMVSAMGVTKSMLRMGSRIVVDFISDNLNKRVTDSASSIAGDRLFDQRFSLADLRQIESVEKKNMPAYVVHLYADGVYRSYNDFAQQQPVPTEIKMSFSKTGDVKSAKQKDANGKFTDISSKDVYAFAYQGRAYICTGYGYYPLKRKVGDFYFTGRVKNKGDEQNVVGATLVFGLLGGLIASSGSSYFDIKVDYVTGGFIRLRETRFD